MSDLLERVARALADADGYTFDWLAAEHVVTCPRMNSKGHWLKLARAAIAALSHPGSNTSSEKPR